MEKIWNQLISKQAKGCFLQEGACIVKHTQSDVQLYTQWKNAISNVLSRTESRSHELELEETTFLRARGESLEPDLFSCLEAKVR